MHNLSLKEISKIKLVSLSKIFFRLVTLKHANDILNTQGNYVCGGRYNPPREFTVLYLGESKNVCKAESNARTTPNLLTSQILGKIEISLEKVLDLTDDSNLEKLGLKKKDLMYKKSENGWTLTQQIARLVDQIEVEAILVPSATGKGNNLVVFDKYIKKENIKLISKKKI
ncbi:MAG: RES family NAD+ phosphorylase [Candidatus Caldatribacteriota bacterium]|nr:RES family NAD+ phosphorylase [Candidatus Caldatribacteriota bacterium]